MEMILAELQAVETRHQRKYLHIALIVALSFANSTILFSIQVVKLHIESFHQPSFMRFWSRSSREADQWVLTIYVWRQREPVRWAQAKKGKVWRRQGRKRKWGRLRAHTKQKEEEEKRVENRTVDEKGGQETWGHVRLVNDHRVRVNSRLFELSNFPVHLQVTWPPTSPRRLPPLVN